MSAMEKTAEPGSGGRFIGMLLSAMRSLIPLQARGRRGVMRLHGATTSIPTSAARLDALFEKNKFAQRTR
jgi:hypothetical protein